jgi:hypothetical protein
VVAKSRRVSLAPLRFNND